MGKEFREGMMLGGTIAVLLSFIALFIVFLPTQSDSSCRETECTLCLEDIDMFEYKERLVQCPIPISAAEIRLYDGSELLHVFKNVGCQIPLHLDIRNIKEFDTDEKCWSFDEYECTGNKYIENGKVCCANEAIAMCVNLCEESSHSSVTEEIEVEYDLENARKGHFRVPNCCSWELDDLGVDVFWYGETPTGFECDAVVDSHGYGKVGVVGDLYCQHPNYVWDLYGLARKLGGKLIIEETDTVWVEEGKLIHCCVERDAAHCMGCDSPCDVNFYIAQEKESSPSHEPECEEVYLEKCMEVKKECFSRCDLNDTDCVESCDIPCNGYVEAMCLYR